jgi:hypothetical protein
MPYGQGIPKKRGCPKVFCDEIDEFVVIYIAHADYFLGSNA